MLTQSCLAHKIAFRQGVKVVDSQLHTLPSVRVAEALKLVFELISKI